MHTENETLLSVKQVSILLKVHPLTVRRYITSGKLKAVKVAGNIRIPQTSLDQMVKEKTPTDPANKPSPKLRTDPLFSLDDPLFRLKGKGMSLKTFR